MSGPSLKRSVTPTRSRLTTTVRAMRIPSRDGYATTTSTAPASSARRASFMNAWAGTHQPSLVTAGAGACSQPSAGRQQAELLPPSDRSSTWHRRAYGIVRAGTANASRLRPKPRKRPRERTILRGLHALYLQHMMSVYLGDPSDRLAHEALEIFEGIGDLVGQGNVLNNLGISSYYRGQWSEALEFYERSAAVRLRSGDVVGAATEDNNVGEILSDQGEYDEARSLFESARAAWLAAGYKVGIAFATSNLGRLAARAGDLVVGRQLLEEALAQFKEINSPIFVAETELRLVECGVLEGEFQLCGGCRNPAS